MTEKAKHTPGPWEVFKGYDGSLSVDATKPFRINNISAGTPVICDVYPHLDADGFSGEANARLIAAAPDMLEAHEPGREGPDFLDWIADRLVNVYGESENVDFVVCLRRRAAKARKAIAKALGEK